MDSSYRAVPQRLFASWEMDRASTSAVQRVFTLNLSHVSIFPFPSQVQSVVITAKLEGYKRTLRSNEISIPECHGRLDVPLDISFTIQYPHFLKYKPNLMQIHIQRRRKYKNRPIPGGFKSVVVGMIDLTQVLQSGSIGVGTGKTSDIPLYTYEESKNNSTTELHSIGRLIVHSCATSPIENDGRGSNGNAKDKVELSSESEISEDEDSDAVEGGLVSARSDRTDTHRGLRDSQRRRKRAQRKNIKQRLANLLKKFRVPEEEVEATASSVGREPTAKELQALFDELDNLSDSGNEGVAPDEVSIVSNPRPALRPFFSSREHIPMTSICDERGSESEGEDLGWSSETPEGPVENSNTVGEATSGGSPWKGNTVTHSLTAHSLSAKDKDKVSRNASLSDQLYTILSNENNGGVQTGNGTKTECIWLCQVSDENMLSSLTAAYNSLQDKASLPPLHLIPANTQKDVRTAIQQIVTKIQNFCNSNSSSPPVTWVGVLGHDRLVSQVLRAYVDALAHKSSSSWLQYLRFALIVPPSSLIGRLIAGIDSTLEQLCRDIWEKWGDLNEVEQRRVVEKMAWWSGSRRHSGSLLNLPIGEALLQLSDREKEMCENSRQFVPFLSEVRVGNSEEEEPSPSTSNSPRGTDHASLSSCIHPSLQPSDASSIPLPSSLGQSSPPASPHSKGSSSESHEMQVEYWLTTSPSESVLITVQSSNQPSTPQGKKDNSKGSMKSHFRSLLVSRSCTNSLLSLTFVKEKRKEKMLQKLGMKNKQKSELDSSPVQISNISRLLCSSQGKHGLHVFVDGCLYSDVRFFQTSSQWQTHVKHFPISLPTPGITPVT